MLIKVLAIDPGVTSGYCYAEIQPQKSMTFFPHQFTDDVDDLWRRLSHFKPRYIVCESFEFRQGKQRAGINLFPRELIGVAKLYTNVAEHDCAIYLQNAATGKAYYSDKLLRELGLMVRGDSTNLKHGIDATRHLLQWMTFGAGYQFCSEKGRINEFATRLETWPINQTF